MKDGYMHLAQTPEKGLLTVGEAAERLNVKERYIKHLIAGRRIDIVKIGRLVRIPETTIEDLIALGYKQAANE